MLAHAGGDDGVALALLVQHLKRSKGGTEAEVGWAGDVATGLSTGAAVVRGVVLALLVMVHTAALTRMMHPPSGVLAQAP